jgi:hypothetical protein
MLDELPLCSVRVERRPEVGAESQVDQGRDERDPTRRVRVDEQAQAAGDERNGDEKGQQGKVRHLLAHQIAQLAAPIRPRSITSA